MYFKFNKAYLVTVIGLIFNFLGTVSSSYGQLMNLNLNLNNNLVPQSVPITFFIQDFSGNPIIVTAQPNDTLGIVINRFLLGNPTINNVNSMLFVNRVGASLNGFQLNPAQTVQGLNINNGMVIQLYLNATNLAFLQSQGFMIIGFNGIISNATANNNDQDCKKDFE
jgi:hypothetical protein